MMKKAIGGLVLVAVLGVVFWVGWTAGQRPKVTQPRVETEDQWVDLPSYAVEVSRGNLSHLSLYDCKRRGEHGTLVKCMAKHDGQTSETYEGWGFEVTPEKFEGNKLVRMTGAVSAPDIGQGMTAEIQMRIPADAIMIRLSHQ